MADLLELRLKPIVYHYLQEWAKTPFSWSENNCAMSINKYIAEVTGKPQVLFPVFRGRRHVERWLEENGGLETIFRNTVMHDYGLLSDCSGGHFGDVGLVPHKNGPIAAIKLHYDDWGARTATGVVIAPAKPLKVWRISEDVR